jgi:PadR family transcriptional regulator PadR
LPILKRRQAMFTTFHVAPALQSFTISRHRYARSEGLRIFVSPEPATGSSRWADDTSTSEASMKPLDQLRKGSTLLAVLAGLERGEVYGYGVRREVHRKTNGIFGLNEGALYPLLHSLKRRGLVRVRREKVRGRWRKYYRITERGRDLVRWRRDWEQLRKVVDVLLG